MGDEAHTCAGPLRGSFGRCHASPCVERDGKRYCGTHDPVAVADRKAKRIAERARQLEDARYDAAVGALARAAGVTAEDLASGAVQILVKPKEASGA